MNEKNTYLSVRPSSEILGLFSKARDLDAESLTNAELYERAGRFLLDNRDVVDYEFVAQQVLYPYEDALPSSFKIKINNEPLDQALTELLREKIGLTRVRASIKLRVVLRSYIHYHLEHPESLPRAAAAQKADDINEQRLCAIQHIVNADPETLSLFIEVLETLSRDVSKCIQQILIPCVDCFAWEDFGDQGNPRPYHFDTPQEERDAAITRAAVLIAMPKGSPDHIRLAKEIAALFHQQWITYDWLVKAVSRILSGTTEIQLQQMADLSRLVRDGMNKKGLHKIRCIQEALTP